MSTLAQLRDDVEADLKDASNAVWTTGEIDRAIARALRALNEVYPEVKIGTISLSADGREIDISSLSARRVMQVWPDYDSSDPEYPVPWAKFEVWPGDILYIHGDEPASGDVIRIWYETDRTINGLNGASTTTVLSHHEEIIILGATAFCALSESIDSMGEVTVHPGDMTSFELWGYNRLKQFRALLHELRQREVRNIDKRVGPWTRDDVDNGI